MRRAPEPTASSSADIWPSAARKVVHREELLREVWGYIANERDDPSVDHAIVRLRRNRARPPTIRSSSGPYMRWVRFECYRG